MFTYLLKLLLTSRAYLYRGVGWGVEGKQVGCMNEEPQVRGCYNITFILAAYILETPVFLWHKGLTQLGGNLTPKLPTCSRTKIKARCEHGNIINIHYLHQ